MKCEFQLQSRKFAVTAKSFAAKAWFVSFARIPVINNVKADQALED
jgi:hypothetical protein